VSKEKDQVLDKLRWVIIGSLVALMTMSVVAGVVILATGRPKDETIVPRVVGVSLSEAMILLQNSDLSAEITTRFVDDPQYTAGLVLQQSPIAGSYTKVGNYVQLSVSSGLAISSVENFVGMKMEDVRTQIVSRYNGLITIKEPLIYLSSQEPIGTVIGQDPKAGEPLSGPISVAFLVSRGMVQQTQLITAYEGLALERALTLASQNNLPFVFVIEGEATDGHPVVASQQPAGGTELESGANVMFTLRPVRNSGDMILGTHRITIPQNASPLRIEMIAVQDDGREELLFSTYQQDVTLVAPYYQPVGTQILIRANGNDQGSFTVGG
jgi:eukaryotic-like serine/threonine-protein kinase